MRADASPWRRRGSRPLVFGHRGASAHRVENTLTAFAAAAGAGADGVELDVRLCASGEVVVFHDDDLRRLADRPEHIDTLSLRQLRAVELREGERIPTLDEVFESFPDLPINVELKAEAGRGAPIADAALRCIARHRAHPRVLVSSFEPVALARVRLRAPHLATGYLFHRKQARALRYGLFGPALLTTALHPDSALVTRHTMRWWKRLRFTVNTWTVDDPTEIHRVAGLGVDAIITNDPAATLATLAARR